MITKEKIVAENETLRHGIARGSGIRWAVQECSTRDKLGGAVGALLDAIAHDDSELVLLFCSPQFHIPEIAAAVGAYGGSGRIAGCTTAGELTPLGHRDGTIAGISLPSQHFVTSLRVFEQLSKFEIADGFTDARTMLVDHEAVQARQINSPSS